MDWILSGAWLEHAGQQVQLYTTSYYSEGTQWYTLYVETPDGETTIHNGEFTLHYTVVSSEADGSVSGQVNFTLDTTPPEFTPYLPDPDTSELHGPNAILQIADPLDYYGQPGSGLNLDSITVNEGNDSVPFDIVTGGIKIPNLENGTYYFVIHAADYAGNAADYNWTVVVDRVLPTISNFSPGTGEFLYNLYPEISATFQTTGPNSIDADSLYIFITDANGDSIELSELNADPGGFSAVLSREVLPAEGIMTVVLAVSDIEGNSSSLYTFDVLVDRTPPDIRFVVPFDGSVITVSDPIFSGTLIDLGSGIDFAKCSFSLSSDAELSVDFETSIVADYFADAGYGSEFVRDFRAWQTVGSIALGKVDFTIEARDIAGNRTYTTRSFWVSDDLPYGFGNDACLFTLNYDFAPLAVVKATVGGSDITADSEISYSLFDVDSNGPILEIADDTPEGTYALQVSVLPDGAVEPFLAAGKIKIGGDPFASGDSGEDKPAPKPDEMEVIIERRRDWDNPNRGYEPLEANTTNEASIGSLMQFKGTFLVNGRDKSANATWSWEIDDNPLEYYKTGWNENGEKKELAQPATAREVKFYWVKSGGVKNVKLTATFNGKPYSVTEKIKVIRPKLDYFKGISGKVSSTNNPVQVQMQPVPGQNGNHPVLSFGQIPGGEGVAGMTWKYKVSMPKINTNSPLFTGDGKLLIIQVMNTSRLLYMEDETWKNALLEDAVDADPNETFYEKNGTALRPEGEVEDVQGDTPGQALDRSIDGSDIREVYIYSEQFKTYLMYLDRRPKSIPVTLAKLDWRWGGNTARNPDDDPTDIESWFVTPGDSSEDVDGFESEELPTWQMHKAQMQWIPQQ